MQETGDFCGACGMPFPADKLDFSDAGSTDQSLVPQDVTDQKSSEDPFASEETQNIKAEEPAAPSEEPAAGPSSEKKEEAVKDPQNKTEAEKDQEDDEDESEFSEGFGQRKILYSAREAGETVFNEKRGFFSGTVSGTSGNKKKEGGKLSAPSMSGAYDGKKYKGEHTFALISFICNCVGLLTCGLISFALALVAYFMSNSLVYGKASDPKKTSTRVKVLATIADVMLAIWFLWVMADFFKA